ncbi:hypothetical protein DSO57_1011364 [Entomophthora muscae]|uniref:Uncharacterized protein n=1 Tax=Entomophthora muscae TaxID=34485 RepID=A0ACC2SVX4_9FUNG|nr:hypothetical protein DSO57_1011364 [Entomophthora muscae]
MLEIFGLHIFQVALSLPEILPPEDPGTASPLPYPCHGLVKAQRGNAHLLVPVLTQLRRLLQKNPEATLSEANNYTGINKGSPQDVSEMSQL